MIVTYFQSLLNFLQEVEQCARLAEFFQRWEVALQTSVDVLMNLDTFIQITRIRVKSKMKDTIVRESYMRGARCGLEMVRINNYFYTGHMHKVGNRP